MAGGEDESHPESLYREVFEVKNSTWGGRQRSCRRCPGETRVQAVIILGGNK